MDDGTEKGRKEYGQMTRTSQEDLRQEAGNNSLSQRIIHPHPIYGSWTHR